VLVALDADEAGEEAAAYWLKVLPNAERWRPWWDDPNQLMMDGVDLRTWLIPAFQQQQGVARSSQAGGQGAAPDQSFTDTTLDLAAEPEIAQAPDDQSRSAPTMSAELESQLEQLLTELGRTPGMGMEFSRPGHPGFEAYQRFCALEREWIDSRGH
jgi:hypothetical protein